MKTNDSARLIQEAEAWQDLGNLREASRTLDRVPRRDRTASGYIQARGFLAMSRGDAAGMRRMVSQLLRHCSADPWTHVLIAYLKCGFTDSEQPLLTIAEQYPADAFPQLVWYHVHVKRDFAKAFTYLTKAIELGAEGFGVIESRPDLMDFRDWIRRHHPDTAAIFAAEHNLIKKSYGLKH